MRQRQRTALQLNSLHIVISISLVQDSLVFHQSEGQKCQLEFQGYLCQWKVKVTLSLEGVVYKAWTSDTSMGLYYFHNFPEAQHLSSHVGMQSGNICVFALWIQSSFLCIDGFLRSETWDVGWWYGTTWMLQTVSECDLWTQLLYLFLGRASGVLEKAVFSSLIFEGTLGFIVVGV